jgi:hypothetical protein
MAKSFNGNMMEELADFMKQYCDGPMMRADIWRRIETIGPTVGFFPSRAAVYNAFANEALAMLHGITPAKVPGSRKDYYIYDAEIKKQALANFKKSNKSAVLAAINDVDEKRAANVRDLVTEALSDEGISNLGKRVKELTEERDNLEFEIENSKWMKTKLEEFEIFMSNEELFELAKSLTDYDKKLVAAFHKVCERTDVDRLENALLNTFSNDEKITDKEMIEVFNGPGTDLGRKWACITYLLRGEQE